MQMLGKSLTYLTDKRKKLLIRTDTSSVVNEENEQNTSNNNTSTNCNDFINDCACNNDETNDETVCRQNVNYSFIQSKHQQYLNQQHFHHHHNHHKPRASSPPSTIKYRIRTKSPNITGERKISDSVAIHKTSSVSTPTSSRRSSSTQRSLSIDNNSNNLANQSINQKLLKNVASVAIHISKNQRMTNDEIATTMKLSRSFSKRMPRSGSAKNLMELRDDSSLVWNDGKLMQRDISNLFKAVESNDLKGVESILSAHPNIVNSFNNIDLTPLDMAMLLNYSTVAKRLVEYGGKNNEYFENESPRFLLRHLTLLTNNCASQLLEMCSHLYGSSGSINRDIEVIESLHCQLKQLKSNLDSMKPGSPPRKVTLDVTGLCSLLVTVYPPSDSLVTRYRIEWSRTDDFEEIDDEIIVRAQFPIGRYQVLDLQPHVSYYVRVASFNLKGSGNSVTSKPPCETASCWTEANVEFLSGASISRRCWPHPSDWWVPECLKQLGELETQLQQQLQFWLASLRTTNQTITNTNNIIEVISTSDVGSEEATSCSNNNNNLVVKDQKKSLFKSLLSNSSKFVRSPKQGLYLALVYRANDTEKILACNDEQLPFIQVDEEHPNVQTVTSDAAWLTRLLANSPDLRLIAQLLSKLPGLTPPSLQIRAKLIASLFQLQHTLHSPHIGLPPPVPSCVIHEKNYSVIILTRIINSAKPTLYPPPTPLKWVGQAKITRNNSSTNPLFIQNESSFSSQGGGLEEDLYNQLESHLSFYRRLHTSFNSHSSGLLDDGLYLGYMQCRSSLDQLFVLHHISTSPLLLPMIKVRDNWHVDAKEWTRLHNIKDHSNMDESSKGDRFHILLVQAWSRLQQMLKLSPDVAKSCRLYLEEVIWLRPRLKLLLVVPCLEDFCLPPGQTHDPPLDLEWSPLWCLELYGTIALLPPPSTNHYASWTSLQASSADLLIPLAQHSLRQAFERIETDQAKERLDQLLTLQGELDKIGRRLRWTVDVVANCRDRNLTNLLTIPMETIVDQNPASRAVLCTEIHCPESQQIEKPCSGRCQSNNKIANPKEISNTNTTNNSAVSTPTSASPNQNHLRKGILRIYAGYPTGLLEGTSVKILLTPQTTAIDIVQLIVRQLNTTSRQRNLNSPFYNDSDINNKFALVVTIDQMSRPLPDNFHPLLLKQPWKSGKLTVKFKDLIS